MAAERPSVLFSAPHAFLREHLEPFAADLRLQLDEIWLEEELPETSDAAAWVPNPGQHFVIGEGVLDRFPRLRALVTPSTGTNHIDAEACASRGVVVRGLLDDRAALDRISASAEFTFLLVLNSLRRLDVGLREVAAGHWRRNEDELRGHELEGRAAGLIGFGRIGRRVARYLAAFGASARFYDPYVPEASEGAERIDDLRELVAASDVLVVCCALTRETRGLVDAELLDLLPAGAAVVNTARGEVLDEPAVAAFLEARPDVSFAADVVTGEVRGEQNESPLVALSRSGRVVVTPHIAGATVESQAKAATAALTLVEAELRS